MFSPKRIKETLKFRGQPLEQKINTMKFAFPQSSEIHMRACDSLETSEIRGLQSRNKP